ncbi:hypothetical protein H113_02198 [Trichophyton rubrum MR1459]|nr:hypothetical protein H113_02198 [Trichophyton rubrum MR1459]EZG08875.1 hypothetical protein H106_02058 [Trichophyton rubrum CBS 735.88]KMQ42552.1 hypothetical protein HL42_6762 [Trichophyton rubrum]
MSLRLINAQNTELKRKVLPNSRRGKQERTQERQQIQDRRVKALTQIHRTVYVIRDNEEPQMQQAFILGTPAYDKGCGDGSVVLYVSDGSSVLFFRQHGHLGKRIMAAQPSSNSILKEALNAPDR